MSLLEDFQSASSELEVWTYSIAIFLYGFFLAYLLFIIITRKGTYSDGYRNGQIDAINGKIKYELKENEDKSTEWTEKERNDE